MDVQNYNKYDRMIDNNNNNTIKLNKGFQFDISEFFKKFKHFLNKIFSKKQKEKVNKSIQTIQNLVKRNNERINNNFIKKFNISLNQRFNFKEFLLQYWKRDITKINIIQENNKYNIQKEPSNFKKGVIFDSLLDKNVKVYKISWGDNIPSVSLKINKDKEFINEIEMIKRLTIEFLKPKKTPHIMMYINDYINPSISKNDRNQYIKKFTSINSTYFDFGESKDFRGLLSEYADIGDLKMFLEKQTITEELCRQIFFQLLYTLFTIYEIYPNFHHGDFKIDNILVCSIIDDPKKYIQYQIFNRKYYLPCLGFQLRLWDFDRSNLGKDKKESSVNKDIDLFIKSFLLLFKQKIQEKTKIFINEISNMNITTNTTLFGIEKYNEKRDLENLKRIIWKESDYFKDFLKKPEEEEIIEYYNSDVIALETILNRYRYQ